MLACSTQADKCFSEKTFRLSLMMQSARRRSVEVAATDIDVAQFAQFSFADQGATERRVNFTFSLLPVRAGKASKSWRALASEDAPVDVHTSVATLYLKDLAVDPDEESISSVVRDAHLVRVLARPSPCGARARPCRCTWPCRCPPRPRLPPRPSRCADLHPC